MSEKTNRNVSPNPTNYLVMSCDGKLIFSKYGDEASLSTICGLFYTLRAATLDEASLGYGDIQCINTSSSLIVFMTVGAIILLAISYKDSEGLCDTVDYLHRQLECIYSAIIFTLKDEVQYNPQMDISYELGSTNQELRLIIDEMSLSDHSSRSCCWLGGVDIVTPIPVEIRNFTSKVLATECSKKSTIIYAILSNGKKLFNIIQPHAREHQLNSFDLNLLLHFFESQTLLQGSELWFPICLPRLSSAADVYCYHCYLGVADMKLTLVSQEPSIEEFQSLQSTALKIRRAMGIESEKNEILRIYNISDKDKASDDLSGDERLIWERNVLEDTDSEDEILTHDHEVGSNRRFIAYWTYHMKKALDQEFQDELMQNYCNMASLMHFVFIQNVPIRHCDSGADSGGKLAQVFGPPLRLTRMGDDGSHEKLSERKIWQKYQQLSLKLRLGSDSVETTLGSYDELTKKAANGTAPDSINQHLPSQLLLEEDCWTENDFVVLSDEDGGYIALSGKEYVLYAVLPDTLNSCSDDAKILCSALVETLLKKGDELQPLSFL